MKKLIVIAILTTVSGQLFAQGEFQTLMQKSLVHFQKSTELKYSLEVGIYKDSLTQKAESKEYMHVYRSARKYCIMTQDMLMIEEKNTTVSVMKDEKVVVLQALNDSFQIQYIEQMTSLLKAWELLEPAELPGSTKQEVVYRLNMPSGSEYSAVEMTFNRTTGLLVGTSMWLQGEYYFGDEVFKAPRIELKFTELQQPQVTKLATSQILKADFTLNGAYTSYTLHNTL